MKVIADKITMAIATALHGFDLLQTTTHDETLEKLSAEVVIKRYRNNPVFHAKVCSLTASVLRSVGDDISELTRQRDLAVEALDIVAQRKPAPDKYYKGLHFVGYKVIAEDALNSIKGETSSPPEAAS